MHAGQSAGRSFTCSYGIKDRKKSPGGGGSQWKNRPKISKKYRKIALFSIFQGGQRKKDRKIVKKGRKIALLSLYLLYLYHVCCRRPCMQANQQEDHLHVLTVSKIEKSLQ